MKPPRMKIRTFCIIVAVIAVILTVGRRLSIEDLAVYGPTVMVLLIGLLRMIGRGGNQRLFWAGFFAGGSAVLLSLLSIMIFDIRIFPIFYFWSILIPFESKYIKLFLIDPVLGSINHWLADVMTAALLILFPVLVAALLGGLITRQIFRRPVPYHSTKDTAP